MSKGTFSHCFRTIRANYASSLTAVFALTTVQSMMSPAIASPPPRPYSSFDSYTTTNTTSGDETDIYFPTLENGTTAENLPAVLLLQGALVDKAFYSDYASQVAQYGFAVSVPNHVQAVPGFGEVLAPDTSKIQVGYNQLVFESTRSASPLAGKVDTDKLGLLGHSLGGAVGLSAIGEVCPPGLCPAPFTRPDALAGGAFFGANLRNENDVFFPISNEGIRRYSQIWCTRQN